MKLDLILVLSAIRGEYLLQILGCDNMLSSSLVFEKVHSEKQSISASSQHDK